MSDPVVTISDSQLRVEPGQVIQTTLTVTNVGDQVEGYAIEVCKGPARHWCETAPRTVELLPGDHMDVVVTFRPPRRRGAPAGEYPVGLLVVSKVDSSRRAVVECDVAVQTIYGIEARLVAVSGRGRHRGRFRLDIENTGTAPTSVAIEAQQDAEPSLSFAVQPQELHIRPGETSSSYLLVRPTRPTMFGRQENNPFWVSYHPRDSEEAGPAQAGLTDDQTAQNGRIDGIFVRKPFIPPGLVALTAVLAVLGIAAVTAARLLIPTPQPAALVQVVPPSPILRDVTYTPDGITISWQQVPVASGYEVEQLASASSTDVTGVTPAEAALSTKTLPNLPDGEHCFRVVAVDNVGRSQPSVTKCVTVVAGPTPSAEGLSGAFVIYGQPIRKADADSYPRALQAVNDLKSKGLQAKILDSTKTAIQATEPIYLVYLDSFGDRALAQKYCELVAQEVECRAYDPIS